MKASILDFRRHMGRILKALDRNENVTITYRGQEKATIIPKKVSRTVDIQSHAAFGLWAKRNDMQDVDTMVRNIRKGRMNAV
jgi:antitoxin (DNA-binding transcriptional repressor) of toxin-antitoxin stability system